MTKEMQVGDIIATADGPLQVTKVTIDVTTGEINVEVRPYTGPPIITPEGSE